MAKTKYATAQDEAQIRETLGIMTRRLNRIRDGAFPGYNTWGAAKEVITFLVVNGHDHAAAKVARDFAAGRQTFVDDRVGGEAAQSNWSNRVTRRDMFKGIHELNDAPKVGGLVHDGFGGASAAGGPLSAAFHGVAASLGAYTPKTKAPTHYLHHDYFQAATGEWIRVWRKIGTDPRLAPARKSAQEDGDRVTTAKKSATAYGRAVTRRFAR